MEMPLFSRLYCMYVVYLGWKHLIMPDFPTVLSTRLERLLCLNADPPVYFYFPIFCEWTVEWQKEKPSRPCFSRRLPDIPHPRMEVADLKGEFGDTQLAINYVSHGLPKRISPPSNKIRASECPIANQQNAHASFLCWTWWMVPWTIQGLWKRLAPM